MIRSLKQALVNWVLAYWLATVTLVILTIILGTALGLPSAKELGVPVGSSPSWLASFPYQPPVNLLVFLGFAWRYLRRAPKQELMREALGLTLIWGLVSAAGDFLFWIVIPSPMQLSLHDFYYVYGPTVLTIYGCIVISPILVGLWLRRRTTTTTIEG